MITNTRALLGHHEALIEVKSDIPEIIIADERYIRLEFEINDCKVLNFTSSQIFSNKTIELGQYSVMPFSKFI